MPRDVGDWTREKLRILELYLAGYLQATTRTRERIYVDGFSGPGKNRLRRSGDLIDGSPLIALKAKGRNGTRFSRLFFIEQDESLAAELRQEIAAVDQDNRCQVLPGDVNLRLPELMESIPKLSPTFIFLDTEGIDPRWSTLERIHSWQVELFINFPLGMSINRNPDSAKTLEYFGTPDCLPILNSQSSGRTRALLNLYKRRLADLGLDKSPENDHLIRTEEGQRLYYLMLASKVEAAKTIMDWVFRQPDYRGQAQLGI